MPSEIPVEYDREEVRTATNPNQIPVKYDREELSKATKISIVFL